MDSIGFHLKQRVLRLKGSPVPLRVNLYVWAFVVLGIASVWLIKDLGPLRPDMHLPFLLLVPPMILASSFILRIPMGSMGAEVNLYQVVCAWGILFEAPWAVNLCFAIVMTGSLVVRGFPAIRTLLNASAQTTGHALFAFIVYHIANAQDLLSPQSVLALLLGMLASVTVTFLAVTFAIRISGHAAPLDFLPPLLDFGLGFSYTSIVWGLALHAPYLIVALILPLWLINYTFGVFTKAKTESFIFQELLTLRKCLKTPPGP